MGYGEDETICSAYSLISQGGLGKAYPPCLYTDSKDRCEELREKQTGKQINHGTVACFDLFSPSFTLKPFSDLCFWNNVVKFNLREMLDILNKSEIYYSYELYGFFKMFMYFRRQNPL